MKIDQIRRKRDYLRLQLMQVYWVTCKQCLQVFGETCKHVFKHRQHGDRHSCLLPDRVINGRPSLQDGILQLIF